ncbi:hypothetical protein AGMMS49992_14990 [Clostridia bacterium]|nr:hypothetical protein AGMMS49992_14990 [Clostridia bacterium]
MSNASNCVVRPTADTIETPIPFAVIELTRNIIGGDGYHPGAWFAAHIYGEPMQGRDYVFMRHLSKSGPRSSSDNAAKYRRKRMAHPANAAWLGLQTEWPIHEQNEMIYLLSLDGFWPLFNYEPENKTYHVKSSHRLGILVDFVVARRNASDQSVTYGSYSPLLYIRPKLAAKDYPGMLEVTFQ